MKLNPDLTSIRPKILVADDVIEICSTFAAFVKALCNADVRTAMSPDAAWKIIKSGFQPDMILSDYDFGIYGDGIEFVRSLRIAGLTTPIAVISSSNLTLIRSALANEDVTVIQKGSTKMLSEIQQFVERSNQNYFYQGERKDTAPTQDIERFVARLNGSLTSN
jgi:CheY-like chemotaxis protein